MMQSLRDCSPVAQGWGARCLRDCCAASVSWKVQFLRDCYAFAAVAPKRSSSSALPKSSDAAPHAIQRDWNDGSIDVLHYAFKSALKWEHEADARDLAFRKNAGNMAILDRLARCPQRLNHFAWPLLGRNWNDSKNSREGFDRGHFVNAFEHEKTNRA